MACKMQGLQREKFNYFRGDRQSSFIIKKVIQLVSDCSTNVKLYRICIELLTQPLFKQKSYSKPREVVGKRSDHSPLLGLHSRNRWFNYIICVDNHNMYKKIVIKFSRQLPSVSSMLVVKNLRSITLVKKIRMRVRKIV
jgi:hypothetical protein